MSIGLVYFQLIAKAQVITYKKWHITFQSAMALFGHETKFSLNRLAKTFLADFEFRPKISLQWNVISTIGKKLVNLQGLPTCLPNLVNFGSETAENGWRVFAHPLHFCIRRHCKPYRIDII